MRKRAAIKAFLDSSGGTNGMDDDVLTPVSSNEFKALDVEDAAIAIHEPVLAAKERRFRQGISANGSERRHNGGLSCNYLVLLSAATPQPPTPLPASTQPPPHSPNPTPP